MPAAAPPPTRSAAAGSGAAAGRSLLGEGFAVGVATSGYQVEGGFNGDGEPHNNWAAWEGAGRAARSGLACDFWRHPEEALDRAASIGCNAFRLSVEWARLEPRPGAYDDGRARALRRDPLPVHGRGLEPIVTLHHFTHPFWLGEEFWLRPGSPDIFARHVARVVPALAPYCRRWVTINEPNIVTLMGWIEGACPPGRRMAVSDAFCALDNLLTAHVLAADVVTARAARRRGHGEHELVVGLRARPDAARPACSCARPASTRTTSTATSTSAGRCTTPPFRRATPGRR